MKTHIPLAVLPALLLAVGCTDKYGDSGLDSGQAGNEAVVWAGWNHDWARLSHRISAERAILNADGSADLGMVGGDWSTGADDIDYPTYRMHHSRITSPGIAVVHGETEMLIGPDGTLTSTESVEAPEVTSMSGQVVVLRGLDILTDVEQTADYPDYDPSLGYCSRGFAMAVGAPSVSGDSVSFDVTATVRWGPAGPEDPIDRSDMNAAIPVAQTGVKVAWTIIGFEGDLTEFSGTAGVDYGTGVYAEMPPLGPDDLGFTATGGSPGFPAIRSFDLAVEVPDNPGQGEYLRSYGVEMFDGGTLEGWGTGPWVEATNSTLVQTATIRFDGTLDAVWVNLSNADSEVIQITSEGDHEVGYTVVPAE